VPVQVVSERLGHASATITLTVHRHVHPGEMADVDMEHLSPCAVDGSGTSSAAGYGPRS
jgi:hypothetical protein